MKDFIIVGGGLAGIAFAETVRGEGCSFVLFDDGSQRSSIVAGGVYNPIILKRLSAAWYAEKGMDAIPGFYLPLETRLDCKVVHPMPVLRRFASIEEQNNWFAAADKPVLSRFLSTDLVTSDIAGLDAPFGFGEVLETGYVDTALLVRSYAESLSEEERRNQTFDVRHLSVSEDHVSYGDVQARHLVFADGFGLKRNPFFNGLPLDGTKGEVLIIRAPELRLQSAIVKAGVFLLPFGDGLFKVGATYAPRDKTPVPTEQGKRELLNGLDGILSCDFQVVDQLAGIRPTVKDRRPLIGTHPGHKRVHLLNGLGSRGVMLAPVMAEMLYRHIDIGEPIDPACDLRRFAALFS